MLCGEHWWKKTSTAGNALRNGEALARPLRFARKMLTARDLDDPGLPTTNTGMLFRTLTMSTKRFSQRASFSASPGLSSMLPERPLHTMSVRSGREGTPRAARLNAVFDGS